MEIYREVDSDIHPNSIILGDCLEVMKSIPDASVDAVIADIPFGVTNCKWDTPIPLGELWTHYLRVTKKTASIVLFAAQPFTSNLIMSKPKLFKYCWYWEKEKGTGFLNSKKQPLRCIEEICVFYRKQATYNPQMILSDKPRTRALPISNTDIHNKVGSIENGDPSKREYITYTHDYPKTILRFPRDNANRSLIPTQKPLKLAEYLVETHTNPGDVVLDNTAGSGTTLVACANLQRRFIGIEMDEKHFQIMEKRLGVDSYAGICQEGNSDKA